MTHSNGAKIMLVGILGLQSVTCLADTRHTHHNPQPVAVSTLDPNVPEGSHEIVNDLHQRIAAAYAVNDQAEVQRLVAMLAQVTNQMNQIAHNSTRTSKKKKIQTRIRPIIQTSQEEGTSEKVAFAVTLALLVGVSIPVLVMIWKSMFDAVNGRPGTSTRISWHL